MKLAKTEVFRAAVMAAIFVLAVLTVVGIALAQSQEEIESVIGAITGELAIAGLALSAIVVVVVGLIRRFTGLDGPKVKLVVLAVSLIAVTLYNVLEGGLSFGASLAAAFAVFVTAVGEHEIVGKWLRQLIAGQVEK